MKKLSLLSAIALSGALVLPGAAFGQSYTQTQGKDAVTVYTTQAAYLAALQAGYYSTGNEFQTQAPYYNAGGGYSFFGVEWSNGTNAATATFSPSPLLTFSGGAGNFGFYVDSYGIHKWPVFDNATIYGGLGPGINQGPLGYASDTGGIFEEADESYTQVEFLNKTITNQDVITWGSQRGTPVTAVGGYVYNANFNGTGPGGAPTVDGRIHVIVDFTDGTSISLLGGTPQLAPDGSGETVYGNSSQWSSTYFQDNPGASTNVLNGQFYGFVVASTDGATIQDIQYHNDPTDYWPTSPDYYLVVQQLVVGDVLAGDAPTVPEPISMIFFGTGLVAVGGYISRRRMQHKA